MQIIPAPSGIKSLQRGAVTISGVSNVNVTVAAVNPDKSSLTFSYSSDTVINTRGKVVNGTTLNFFRSGVTTNLVAVEWELTEYA